MARILVINPNCSPACTAGIDAAVAPFRLAGGPVIDVVGLAEGPPAIYGWAEWHEVVGPLCRRVVGEDADAYVVACGSDPGIEAVRAVTVRPVFGVFRSAVAAAVARAERFGVIALVDASRQRHMAALRAMGLADRMAAHVAMNVTMEFLLDPAAAQASLIKAAQTAVAAGAQTLVLGCTGMAHHQPAIAAAVGVPLIEPCQAAVGLAITTLLAMGN